MPRELLVEDRVRGRCRRGRPSVGEELGEIGGLVDAVENVGDVLEGIHADAGARHDERVEERELLAGILAVNEEKSLASMRSSA